MKSRSHWLKRAETLALPVQPFIDGAFCPSHATNMFAKYNPADGKKLADISEGHKNDVDNAVAAARTAFNDGRWAGLPVQKRKTILLALADLVDKNMEELALFDVLDVGKPIKDALNIDVPLASTIIRYCAESAEKIFGTLSTPDNNTLAFSMRAPRGVVGAIVGWNFPLVLAVQKIAPALATGNSIVLKPSELSSFSALRLAQLATEAGVPEGVINVIPGLGATVGDALARHMDVDMLTFTGSSATGKRLLQSAGTSNMKRLLLECGGKSPNIVFADCPDLDAVADGVIAKMFWNQGQVCTAGTRLIVENTIKQDLLAKIIKKAGKIIAGDPLDPDTGFGALISEGQMNKVLNYIKQGQDQGASLLLGGNRVNRESGGYFVEPTIFDDVRPEMIIAQEEIFGPVLSVMQFDSLDEAANLANSSIYGLSGSVWTTSLAKAQRMIQKLQVGEITVNATARPSGGMPFAATPLEAHKQSGMGVESGIEGLQSYTCMKFVQFHV